MNEPSSAKPSLDRRTGVETYIHGPIIGYPERSACDRLNRQRAGLIMAIFAGHASGESTSVDDWIGSVARRTIAWDIPFIPLQRLSISREESGGHPVARDLTPLKWGQEAFPFLDPSQGVVYKLFDLKGRSSIGRKLYYERLSEYEFDLRQVEANLENTLEKIAVLHQAGALPTEIVGLADSCDFLIVKQPQARTRPYSDGERLAAHQVLFEEERMAAIAAIKGVPCTCPGLRQTTVVISVNDKAYFVSDLHERNIMQDAAGGSTIIDALIGEVPASAVKMLPVLQDDIRRAAEWRKGHELPPRLEIQKCDDSEL